MYQSGIGEKNIFVTKIRFGVQFLREECPSGKPRLCCCFVFYIPFFLSGENLSREGGGKRGTSLIASVVCSNAFILCKESTGIH